MSLPVPRALAFATFLLPGASVFGACGGATSGSSGTGVSSLCSTLSSYASRCGITDPCTQASLNSCSALFANYSPAAVSAIETCANGAVCGDAGNSAVGTCIQAGLAKITPSAAQEKLAEDYCTECPSGLGQTAAQCATSFYSGVGGSGFGLGSLLLQYNDSVAEAADAKCVPAGDAGFGACFSFFSCVTAQAMGSTTTPPQCTSTSTGGGGGGPTPAFDAGSAPFPPFDGG